MKKFFFLLTLICYFSLFCGSDDPQNSNSKIDNGIAKDKDDVSENVESNIEKYKKVYNKKKKLNFSKIVLSNINGSINVKSQENHNTKDVDIKATVYSSKEEWLDKVKIEYYEEDFLNIVTDVPKGIKAKTDYDLIIPDNITLEADTKNGDIKLDNIDGEIIVTTSNGKVYSSKINGSLDINCYNGDVNAEDISGSLSVKSYNGIINGKLALKQSGKCWIKNHNGNINLKLNKDASASVKLQTLNGNISTDFIINREMDYRNRIQGKIGDGEGTIFIKSYNGNINLKQFRE